MSQTEQTEQPGPGAPAELTPAQMSDRTGVTIDTLRYYEKEGLLRNVARADSGHRRYREGDVLWVEVLRCLRETGMTMEQLRHYCELGEQGDHTAPDRRRILVEHRALVEQRIAEWRAALERIDHKISFYGPAAPPSEPGRSDGGSTGREAGR